MERLEGVFVGASRVSGCVSLCVSLVFRGCSWRSAVCFSVVFELSQVVFLGGVVMIPGGVEVSV